MIARQLHRLKVEKSRRVVTSFAGLPLLTELAHQTGLIRDLDQISGLWERQGRFGTADYVMGLASTLITGGEGMEDTRLLREDPGVRELIFPSLPAPNTLGEFLRRFGHRTLHRLGVINAKQVRRLLSRGSYKRLTLDVDSTLVESHKKEATKTYKGFRGYNPVLAWLAEPDAFLAGLFRLGHASPQSHLLSLLRLCRRLLPKGTKLRLRADSAAYQLKVMEYCVNHGMEFTIGADLDPAVREAIEEIPRRKWQLVVRNKETFLLAETVHAPGGAESRQPMPAFRLIVTKKLSGQLELFKDPIKYRAIITDFPAESWTAEQIWDHHNGRGTAEKAIGEIKNGFGLDRLPCGQLHANAAFLQVCLIAYNLVQTFKHVALPKGWSRYGIKNLRFRLLCQAALVVRHARQLSLKLSESFPFFEVFERARWAVLSPMLTGAG